jgi:hypothetical protein
MRDRRMRAAMVRSSADPWDASGTECTRLGAAVEAPLQPEIAT